MYSFTVQYTEETNNSINIYVKNNDCPMAVKPGTTLYLHDNKQTVQIKNIEHIKENMAAVKITVDKPINIKEHSLISVKAYS